MIDRCVRCGYSLKGLPTVHRCPECGRENDRESVVIREPRLLPKMLAVVGVVIIVAWAALVWLGGGSLVWYRLIAPAALVLVGAWIQLSRRARVVVVSRRRLELIDEFSEVRSYSIDDLVDVQWNPATGAVGVTDHQGETIVTIPKEFLGTKRASWKIVVAIRALAARRESSPPAP